MTAHIDTDPTAQWECPYCGVAKSPEKFSETSDSCKDCESEEDHLTPLRSIMSHFEPRTS